MNDLHAIKSASRRYRDWLHSPVEPPVIEARKALAALLDLYAAALQLDDPGESSTGSPTADALVDDTEWKAVYALAARLPFQYYSEVFNALAIPAEEPVIGDLADDVADVYRDVIAGLRLLDSGDRASARWQWKITLFHWGEHATSGIRALHCFLVAEDGLCNSSV